MRKEEFTRKDETKGNSYHAEAGDKVLSRYATVSTRTNSAGYDNHSLGVTHKGEDIYLTLTGGQKKAIDLWLEKNVGKNLDAREIIFEEYTNEYGAQVGARVGNIVIQESAKE